MVDLEAIGEISNACSSFIGVCYDNDFMPSVDKLG